jgi:hypothetical protein
MQPGSDHGFRNDRTEEVKNALTHPFRLDLPHISLCQQVVYGLAPMDVDTGAGFVTPDNYAAVADLATEGLR